MDNDRKTQEITQRAIDWILANFGNLSDLPRTDAHVVWVTTYRAIEVTCEAEQAGGATGMPKDQLMGGNLGLRFRHATNHIDFLLKMVPEIRATRDIVCSAMLVEMLKYGNLDAPHQSRVKRALARFRARVDPMYSAPIPPVSAALSIWSQLDNLGRHGVQ